MAIDSKCPNCGAGELRIFHETRSVPSNSCILLETRADAVAYPRGDIALGFCRTCGFITNTAFDAKLTEYSGRYEETQGFSPTFNEFHKRLAERLVDRFDLHGKEVLEIGCGKGEFLMLLCELGDNHGVGFDPAYVPERNLNPAADRVEFIRDFYSEKYAHTDADFVCCKMTLEHIHPTAEFIGMVRRAIGDRPESVVFFQIPDVTRIMRDCAFEDIYSDDEGLAELSDLVDGFGPKFAERVARWQDELARFSRDGSKVVLWGSGSKGVSFLSTLDVGDQIQYAVDINPYRQGYFMPGSGLEIVGPEFLRQYAPDVVIIMNAIYRREIGEDLQKLGLAPEILTA
jgi:SAM-dependent methyltransferase